MVTKRQEAADAVTLAKRAAEARLAEQQAAVGQIAAQRRALVAELAAARHTSVRLERARQAGIAAAQAAAERRAEAKRRAAAEAAAAGNDGGGGRRWRRRRWRRRRWRRRRRRLAGHRRGGSSSGTSTGAQAAIDFARAQIGKPYQWGADGPGPFDCSGLTMRAWQQGGVSLPHYSVAQYEQARRSRCATCAPATWSSSRSDSRTTTAIYHVGLYIGGGNMIEAPYTGANVRISSIWRSSLFGAARP